jgi:hypothetical protein
VSRPMSGFVCIKIVNHKVTKSTKEYATLNRQSILSDLVTLVAWWFESLWD